MFLSMSAVAVTVAALSPLIAASNSAAGAWHYAQRNV
jgi:hypothetical protein